MVLLETLHATSLTKPRSKPKRGKRFFAINTRTVDVFDSLQNQPFSQTDHRFARLYVSLF
jgi:hypothetical protein